MTSYSWLQLGVLVAILLVSTRVLGAYIAGVFGGDRALGDRVFAPIERLLYRAFGVDPTREQTWPVYALALIAFSLVSVLGLYLLQRIQGYLPLDPTDAEGRTAGARVQHRGQLRHQHELAELRRRVDDEPPDPDGRAHGAELRVSRSRPVRSPWR